MKPLSQALVTAGNSLRPLVWPAFLLLLALALCSSRETAALAWALPAVAGGTPIGPAAGRFGVSLDAGPVAGENVERAFNLTCAQSNPR